MDITNIPEVKTTDWIVDDNSVIINLGREKLLFNESVKIVWELINGINSIQEIIAEIKAKYGQENDEKYLNEIVESSIQLLLEHKVITMRTTNEFDGWLQYQNE